ncbi:MAG TPA: aldehyde dehydrogenase family protein, partial [Allosphingosinicella sp.]|nr:aldehyde dehydrogenase family protein [Allosphingosinicella sp.]
MMNDLVCISPVDGREYARRALSTDSEIERALAEARGAQGEWARAPLNERCAVILRFLEAMEALNPAIVPELAWQMGRPVRNGGEFRSLAERVRAMVDLAASALAPFDAEAGRAVVRVPAGLVL